MITSNFQPIRLSTGYYIRKRILHSGYEILAKDWLTEEFTHVEYIEEI
jgi:hypothetical protein